MALGRHWEVECIPFFRVIQLACNLSCPFLGLVLVFAEPALEAGGVELGEDWGFGCGEG